MRDLMQDVRFALRTLRKTPIFTVLAIITIALGVGANTAAFSMVRGVLMRRPAIRRRRPPRARRPTVRHAPDVRFSVPEISDYRRQVASFAAVAEYHSMPFQL